MCTKIEKIKKKEERDSAGVDWLARWRAWSRWMTLYFPRVHPDYRLKSGHKSSWILYRYVPAGGTAVRGRKFHRDVAPSRERKEVAGKMGEAKGIQPEDRGKKREKDSFLGQPREVLAGGCYGGCPKIEFAGTRERLIKCLRRATMRYYTYIL